LPRGKSFITSTLDDDDQDKGQTKAWTGSPIIEEKPIKGTNQLQLKQGKTFCNKNNLKYCSYKYINI
jgi:hypothetical protein